MFMAKLAIIAKFAAMDAPQLTMIIPVRNREHLVGRTLECVATELKRARFNLVVVDNGSTDATRDVVSRWMERNRREGVDLRLIDEPKPGACAARNAALELTTTPYVMFFDSDDLFEAGHVERIVGRIEANTGPAPDLYVWRVSTSQGAARHELSTTPASPSLKHHIYHASLATQRYCVATSFIRGVGRWNEALPVWNDYELGVRLLLNNPLVEFIDGRPMVTIVPQRDSITGVRYRDREVERMAALDEIERQLKLAGRQSMVKHVEARRVLLAAQLRREGSNATASRLLHGVLSRSSFGKCLLFTLAYALHALFGRGGSPLVEFQR